MIKVIASDMDGTLLNEQHMLNARTAETIKKAQNAGIRFIIATGRAFDQALQAMGDEDIKCDFIVSSGAEVRNPQKEVVRSGCMDIKDCKQVYEVLRKYKISFNFEAADGTYCIGSAEEMEQNMLGHLLAFNHTLTEAQVRELDFFKSVIAKTKVVPAFEDLEKLQVRIIKIFVMSNNLELLKELNEELQQYPNLAVASSFDNNLEITDVEAQKGPVLKEYIESLGYTMDEVMVFGDSMNDYSMISMDFGATVAMENASEKLKKAAKYITKSNVEDGVAYAIEELLKSRQ